MLASVGGRWYLIRELKAGIALNGRRDTTLSGNVAGREGRSDGIARDNLKEESCGVTRWKAGSLLSGWRTFAGNGTPLGRYGSRGSAGFRYSGDSDAETLNITAGACNLILGRPSKTLVGSLDLRYPLTQEGEHLPYQKYVLVFFPII